MKAKYSALAAMVIALALMTANPESRAANADLSGERITFKSGEKDFDRIFPVTENLNQILAEVTRTEVENGRDIPNFIVYPYEAEQPDAEPFVLLWKRGRYVKQKQLPPAVNAILVYDPRRLSAGDEEIEGGQRIEYRHFVVRYNFNESPQSDGEMEALVSRLEPTDSSIYISRAVLKAGQKEKTSAEGVPTHQLICFPRISIPKQFNGEEVRMISLQFESALHRGSPDEVPSEGGVAPDETIESSERSVVMIN